MSVVVAADDVCVSVTGNCLCSQNVLVIFFFVALFFIFSRITGHKSVLCAVVDGVDFFLLSFFWHCCVINETIKKKN